LLFASLKKSTSRGCTAYDLVRDAKNEKCKNIENATAILKNG
jgi:hypothetical protein